jgi:AcrR family transcriptional regulator
MVTTSSRPTDPSHPKRPGPEHAPAGSSSHPGEHVGLGRPRDEAREQAIIDATLALVAEVGLDRLTMDAVAARARSSKATIYRRWAGKHDLVAGAMRHYVADGLTEVDTGSLRGDLVVLATEVRRKVSGFDGRLILGLAQASLNDPELCRAIDQQMRDAKNRLPVSVVLRAIARGDLPEGADPNLFDEIVPAVAVMRIMAGQHLDDTFIDHVVDDLLIPALRHPPARSAPPTPPAPPTLPEPRSNP